MGLEIGPGFDQQPIEVAAIADACARPHRITADPRWLTGVDLAWRWFLGENDTVTAMFDPVTGGGYDGLERTGRNDNQGAESTLAMLSTAQQARRALSRHPVNEALRDRTRGRVSSPIRHGWSPSCSCPANRHTRSARGWVESPTGCSP